MPKYLLLNAVIPEDFGCDVSEMIEAANEFGCSVISSTGLRDVGSIPATRLYYYFVSDTIEAMTRMVNDIGLDGHVIEYTAVFDQTQTDELIIKKKGQ